MKAINYEIDYSPLYTESSEDRSAHLTAGISGYRTKTIRSGDIVECEIYPIWKRSYARSAKKHITRAAQQRQNEKNSLKNLVRLINTNFTAQDIWITLTYSDDNLPKDDEQAYRDTVNYIRRLRRSAARANAPPLKYIIVTEVHDESGEVVRVHHHMVTNFSDRDEAERLWHGGGRTQSRRLQPDENGLTGLALYIGKQKAPPGRNRRVRRRWRGSKNLTKPKVTVSDTKISRRAVRRLAKMSDAERREYFERLYKNNGCRCIETTISYSPVVSGAYIRVRMRR